MSVLSRPLTVRAASRLALAAGLLGCGSHKSTPTDGATDASSTCDAACLLSWWSEVTGSCGAICSLSPKPRECADVDCQQVMFYDLSAPNSYDSFLASYSASARQFTLFTKSTGTWAIPSTCHLTTNPSTDPQGSPFTCSATTVTLPTRNWSRMTPALEAAVMSTAGGQLPAQGSY